MTSDLEKFGAVLDLPRADYRNARLVSRHLAAEYCGLSISTFSHWVKLKRLPPAIHGTARWDLKAIDAALDSLSGLESHQQSPLDDWRSRRARRS